MCFVVGTQFLNVRILAVLLAVKNIRDLVAFGRYVGLTTLPPSCVPIVLKSGSLNPLEPSGLAQACNGIALPYCLLWAGPNCVYCAVGTETCSHLLPSKKEVSCLRWLVAGLSTRYSWFDSSLEHVPSASNKLELHCGKLQLCTSECISGKVSVFCGWNSISECKDIGGTFSG